MTDETAKKCEKALRTALLAWSHRSRAVNDVNEEREICTALAALQDERAEPPRPAAPEQQTRERLERRRKQGFMPFVEWRQAEAANTPEQKASDLVQRTQEAASFTELANLIASHERLLIAVEFMPAVDNTHIWWAKYGKPAIEQAWKPDDV